MDDIIRKHNKALFKAIYEPLDTICDKNTISDAKNAINAEISRLKERLKLIEEYEKNNTPYKQLNLF